MTRLSMIEGIAEVYEGKLKDAGVNSIEAFLEAAATKKGRIDLAEKSGISEKLILTWANHADLSRVKGIGSQYVSQNKCIVERRNLIRRLTPLECERLQGFPDGWTLIPGASDTARYK